MRDVVGLVVGRASIRAALVRPGASVWTAETRIAEGAERLAVLRELLMSVPRRGRRRIPLGAVVEPPLVQVRLLEGLPPLSSRLIGRLVSENASALFLKREGGVVVASVHSRGDELWGAAFDREVIDDIKTIAGELRFDLRAVAALSHFLEDVDDPARAATRVNRRSPLAWVPRGQHGAGRTRRSVTVGIGVAGVLAATVVAPIGRDLAEARHLLRELAVDSSVDAEARNSIAELRRLSQVLDDRATFDADRGRVTTLLGTLSDALPDSTALLSLRLNSQDVSAVALSRRVTEMLPALNAAVPRASTRITGAVANEVIDGHRFARAEFQAVRRATPSSQ